MAPCEKGYECQNYFCRKDFPSQKCPLVDVYFDYKSSYNSSSYYNVNLYNIDTSQIKLVSTTQYNQTFTDKETFENLVFPPILNMGIKRSGQCVDGSHSFESPYTLMDSTNCARDQRFHVLEKQDLAVTLNNNGNYWDYLVKKLPLLNNTKQDNFKWDLDVEYSIYRYTLSCLLENYDKLNINNTVFLNDTSVDSNYNYKRLKMRNILSAFVMYDDKYSFQENIQIAILALNCAAVFLNVFVIIFKLCKFFCNCCEVFIGDWDVYVAFLIDLSTAVLGGTSFYIIDNYLSFIDNLISSNCSDPYINYKMGTFSDNLQATSDQNLQIFLIMLFKMFIMIFSVLYYLFATHFNVTCKQFNQIIKDNINEGDGTFEESEKLKSEALEKNPKDIEMQNKNTEENNNLNNKIEEKPKNDRV